VNITISKSKRPMVPWVHLPCTLYGITQKKKFAGKTESPLFLFLTGIFFSREFFGGGSGGTLQDNTKKKKNFDFFRFVELR
jgi:hypothetical protein